MLRKKERQTERKKERKAKFKILDAVLNIY